MLFNELQGALNRRSKPLWIRRKLVKIVSINPVSYIYIKEKQKDEPFPRGSQRLPVIQLYGITFLSTSHCFEPSFVLVLRRLIEGDQRCTLGSAKWCFSLLALLALGLSDLSKVDSVTRSSVPGMHWSHCMLHLYAFQS